MDMQSLMAMPPNVVHRVRNVVQEPVRFPDRAIAQDHVRLR
jgi:hypothetical protein